MKSIPLFGVPPPVAGLPPPLEPPERLMVPDAMSWCCGSSPLDPRQAAAGAHGVDDVREGLPDELEREVEPGPLGHYGRRRARAPAYPGPAGTSWSSSRRGSTASRSPRRRPSPTRPRRCSPPSAPSARSRRRCTRRCPAPTARSSTCPARSSRTARAHNDQCSGRPWASMLTMRGQRGCEQL